MDIRSVEHDLVRSPEAIRSITGEERKKYILLALQRLRPDESLALRLFYLCELSIDEMAEITGFGTSKIKVDLHRGRDNLYFHLKRMLGDEMNQLL